MREPKITVSDHAILRFIERHYGFSVEPIREKIIDLVRGSIGVGAKSHSIDGITFCFEESLRNKGVMVVTTVLERGMNKNKGREKLVR